MAEKTIPMKRNDKGTWDAVPKYSIGGFVGGLFQDLAGDMTAQNPYQGQLAPTQQSNFGGVIDQSGQNALSGYGNFQNNQAQQQQLANALALNAQGQGPNPAQAMLAQSTGNNVANQAALIAGQRGGGANAGLMARQAAMAGANAQQQSAGQAATMQAQQQLAAQQQQAQVLGQMGSQNIAQQGASAGLFGTASGAQNNQNNTNVANYGMMQGLNQKTEQSNADAVNKTTGGLMNGIGGAASMFAMAKGGMVPDHIKHMHSIYHGGDVINFKDGGQVPGQPLVAGDDPRNDTQKALLSPKEIVLPDSVTMAPDAPEEAKKFVAALLKKQGHGNSKHHKEFHKALKEAIVSREKK